MSRLYRILYRLGFTPWDNGIVPAELSALVESQHALSAGRALDLGCGTGAQAIYQAHHGWQVRGVDMVARALEVTRQKASTVGAHATWVQADITQLSNLGIQTDFDLMLDLACFHG